MSSIINAAVEALTNKLGDAAFDGSAKFEIEGEGGIIIDAQGIRASDEDADVTLTADAGVFESILSGDLNPTSAFMSGRLKISGDMGAAMRLGSLLG